MIEDAKAAAKAEREPSRTPEWERWAHLTWAQLWAQGKVPESAAELLGDLGYDCHHHPEHGYLCTDTPGMLGMPGWKACGYATEAEAACAVLNDHLDQLEEAIDDLQALITDQAHGVEPAATVVAGGTS